VQRTEKQKPKPAPPETQKPGRYVFFDDLHQETKGTLIVE